MNQGDIRRKIIKTLSNCAGHGTDGLENSEEEADTQSDKRVKKRKTDQKKTSGKVARRESEDSDATSDEEN